MANDLLIPFATGRNGLAVYTSDECIAKQSSRSRLRVEAFTAYHAGAAPVFACPACRHHVYPKLSPNRRPYWSHIASNHCPLAVGRKLSEDQLDAIIYEGRQEGSAHLELVAELAEMAACDSDVNQAALVVDGYLRPCVPDWHGRFPDVRFEVFGHKVAIEVQLSPISLHRLAQRTIFYRNSGFRLFWVTQCFNPSAFQPTWIWDVWAAQNSTVFSVDKEVIRRSKLENQFLLRRYNVGETSGEIIGLKGVLSQGWVETVKFRWCLEAKNNWGDGINLTKKIIEKINIDVNHEELWAICHTINTLLVIENWTPIGSRQKNPRAIVNDFLNSNDGMLAYQFVRSALKFYKPTALEEGKTGEAIDRTEKRAIEMGVRPWNSKSTMASIANVLFPDWIKT